MAIEYLESAANVSEADLVGFFVGWPNPPTAETHLQILHNSAHVVLAAESDSGQVVGFVTAISDGVLSAYIPLLEVLPAYKGRGIGTELTERMLARLGDLYMVDLLCDRAVQPFYARLDLEPAHGMMRRNYERQSGESF